MKTKLITIVSVNEIFPGRRFNKLSLLRIIGKTHLIDICTHFLRSSSSYGTIDSKESLVQFFSTFFSTANKLYALELREKLVNAYLNYDQSISIINDVVLLLILESALSENIPDKCDDFVLAEQAAFELFLVFNEEYSLKTANSNADQMTFEWINLTMSLHQCDLINRNIKQLFICQATKALYLFKFLDENQPELLKDFLEKIGLGSWKEYFLQLMNVLGPLAHNSSGFISYNQTFNSTISKSQILLVNSEEYLQEEDFVNFRSFPLLKLHDGRFRVLHDIFLFEFLYRVQYFKLAEIYNSSVDNYPEIQNFRSYYGEAFSEETLFYRLMENAFTKQGNCKSGLDYRKANISSAPDYLCHSGTSALIFETKDSLIKKEIKWSTNQSDVEEELKSKFLRNGKKSKAIQQLAKVANSLIVETNEKVLRVHNSRVKKVYPILVLHDCLSEVLGLNLVLNKWFSEELQNLEVDLGHVGPLTIINIDFFIFYSDYLRNKKLDLVDLITSYHNFTNTRKYNNNKIKLGINIDNSQMPFSAYVERVKMKKKKISMPLLLRKNLLEVFPDGELESSKLKSINEP